jgi:hypothetical protein
VIADAVAEMQEHLEASAPGGLGAVRDALLDLGREPVVLEFAGDPEGWLAASGRAASTPSSICARGSAGKARKRRCPRPRWSCSACP